MFLITSHQQQHILLPLVGSFINQHHQILLVTCCHSYTRLPEKNSQCNSPHPHKTRRSYTKVIQIVLSAAASHPPNQSSFHKGQVPWWDNHPPEEIAQNFNMPGPSAIAKISTSICTTLFTVYKKSFTIFCYAFCTWKWSNLAGKIVLWFPKNLI